jgi:hypothetical protein
MKYCIPYIEGLSSINYADEIVIEYKYMEDFSQLIDFLEDHISQKTVLNIKEEDLRKDINLNLIAKTIQKYNLIIRFPYDKNLAEKCIALNIPFYFSTGCQDWDAFYSFLKLGVQEILLINEMGFYVAAAAEKAHKENVKIRIYPNIAQASYNGTDPIKRFFVRPEDIKFYEEYVDICEIYGDLSSIEFSYDIYLTGKWDNMLNFAILNFDEEILSPFLSSNFAEKRLNCGKTVGFRPEN